MSSLASLRLLHPSNPWHLQAVRSSIARAPAVLLLFALLWTAVLAMLDAYKIDLQALLEPKKNPADGKVKVEKRKSQWRGVLHSVLFYAAIYVATVLVLGPAFGMTQEAAVFAFYSVFLLTLFPLFTPGVVRESLQWIVRAVYMLVFPSSVVTFQEVLIADAVTSLSRVLLDLFVTACFYGATFLQLDLAHHHSSLMVVGAMIASLPYLTRIRQCTIQLRGATNLTSRLLICANIGKYMTALPLVWIPTLAAFRMLPASISDRYVVNFAILNTVWSIVWDTMMDWGAFSLRDGVPTRRKHYMFTSSLPISVNSASNNALLASWNPATHVPAAIILNICLRFTWMSRYMRHGMSEAARAFLLIVLEVFRRSIWFVFRIEWEAYQREDPKQQPAGESDTNDDS